MADDPANSNSGAPTPPPAPPTPGSEPLGIRAQLGATFEAGRRLVRAHIDLAKAEAADIAGNVARMVGLFAVAFVMFLLVAMLFLVGGLLFLGEWLFGSIGWGVLLGSLLLLDIALSAVLAALDVSGRRIATAFGVAAILGIVVGVVFGFDLFHRGWDALGATALPQVGDPNRTVNLAVVSLALIGALVGVFVGWRAGGLKGGIGGFIGFAIVGAVLGWVTGSSVPGGVGAALGVLVALITWPLLAGRDLMRTGIDGEALKKKFMPDTTIQLTKETIEWVRARTPLAPKS